MQILFLEHPYFGDQSEGVGKRVIYRDHCHGYSEPTVILYLISLLNQYFKNPQL